MICVKRRGIARKRKITSTSQRLLQSPPYSSAYSRRGVDVGHNHWRRKSKTLGCPVCRLTTPDRATNDCLIKRPFNGLRVTSPGQRGFPSVSSLKNSSHVSVYNQLILGRSIRHLIDLVEELHQRGAKFKSLCDGAVDTTSS